MFAKAFVLASVVALAAAETHVVKVGGLNPTDNTPILKFDPEFVNAVKGDIVQFQFMQKNHSVIQTSFNKVCRPDGGFSTEFFPVGNDVTSNFPTKEFTVDDDTKPLWFYCSQNTHCGKGMIFSINCPATGSNSLDNFRASALRFGEQEAAASSWLATATPDVYGGHTYAPVYAPTVTETVTTGDAVWTTTYQSYQNSPDATPAPAGQETHVINVGEDGLTFSPANITAKPRDILQFVFKSKNHTATQSSFGNPCAPLALPDKQGFDSDFRPVTAGAESPVFEVTVNDTAPIWVYCRQGNHCTSGMVFSVNADPTSARSHDAFVKLATGAGPDEGGDDNTNGGTDNTGAAVASVSIVGGVAGLALAGVGSIFALLL